MTQESNSSNHSGINGHYRGIMVATTLTDTNNVSYYAWGTVKVLLYISLKCMINKLILI